MALVALGGAAYVAFASSPMATLETEPSAPWRVAQEECEYSDHSEYLFNFDWGSERRGLEFCFRAVDNGKIPYAVAPTPEADAKRYAAERAKEEAEDRAREARGEPPPITVKAPPPRWFYVADDFSEPVRAYAQQRVADFRMTAELQRELVAREKTAWWEARWKALNEALPWVLGVCVVIWLFTTVIGWIIRGFAGVPQGQDFRPTAK